MNEASYDQLIIAPPHWMQCVFPLFILDKEGFTTKVERNVELFYFILIFTKENKWKIDSLLSRTNRKISLYLEMFLLIEWRVRQVVVFATKFYSIAALISQLHSRSREDPFSIICFETKLWCLGVSKPECWIFLPAQTRALANMKKLSCELPAIHMAN